MIKISKEINEALNVMGYTKLTSIQEKVIPVLLDNKNIIAKSQTGSGKTASFAIPILEHINWEENKPQALFLACTRELCKQIESETKNIGKFKKIKVTSIHGKAKMDYQTNILKQKCHVVVATPGRLIDHIENNSIDLSNIKYLIIDEADYMLDMGFIDSIEKILSTLNSDVTIGLFSATYPDRIKKLITKYIKNYEIVVDNNTANINHYYIKSNNNFTALLNQLNTLDIESCLIFCEMQKDVDELYHRLSDSGIKSARIHGGLNQKERFKNLDFFKSGKRRILIASDVASRGIDIEKVSHVIHYSMPRTIEEYTHRCGRSGRVNEVGTSILLISEESDLSKKIINEFNLKEITLDIDKDLNFRHLNTTVEKTNKDEKWQNKIQKIYISAGKDKKIRAVDIIGALCSLDNINGDDIGVIEILNKMTYVEIFNNKANYIIEEFKNKTIKNKQVRIELAK